MNRVKAFAVILSFLMLPNVSVADSQLPDYSVKYDDARDPFADANAAITLAKQTNRNVMIKIGGAWCGWCAKMDKFLKDNPTVAKALYDNFVVLKVSVSDANENEAFMKGLPPIMGYPHIFVSSAQGKMLLSKDTGELLAGEEYSVQQWLNFIDNWKVASTNNKTQS